MGSHRTQVKAVSAGGWTSDYVTKEHATLGGAFRAFALFFLLETKSAATSNLPIIAMCVANCYKTREGTNVGQRPPRSRLVPACNAMQTVFVICINAHPLWMGASPRVSASNFPIVYHSWTSIARRPGGLLYFLMIFFSCAQLSEPYYCDPSCETVRPREDRAKTCRKWVRVRFFSGGCFSILTFFFSLAFFQCAIPCYADEKAFVNASYCHSYCAGKKLNSVRLSASASGFFHI